MTYYCENSFLEMFFSLFSVGKYSFRSSGLGEERTFLIYDCCCLNNIFYLCYSTLCGITSVAYYSFACINACVEFGKLLLRRFLVFLSWVRLNDEIGSFFDGLTCGLRLTSDFPSNFSLIFCWIWFRPSPLSSDFEWNYCLL